MCVQEYRVDENSLYLPHNFAGNQKMLYKVKPRGSIWPNSYKIHIPQPGLSPSCSPDSRFQLSANVHPDWVSSLQLTSKTWIQFLAPGSDLAMAVLGTWRKKQRTGALSFSCGPSGSQTIKYKHKLKSLF